MKRKYTPTEKKFCFKLPKTGTYILPSEVESILQASAKQLLEDDERFQSSLSSHETLSLQLQEWSHGKKIETIIPPKVLHQTLFDLEVFSDQLKLWSQRVDANIQKIAQVAATQNVKVEEGESKTTESHSPLFRFKSTTTKKKIDDSTLQEWVGKGVISVEESKKIDTLVRGQMKLNVCLKDLKRILPSRAKELWEMREETACDTQLMLVMPEDESQSLVLPKTDD